MKSIEAVICCSCRVLIMELRAPWQIASSFSSQKVLASDEFMHDRMLWKDPTKKADKQKKDHFRIIKAKAQNL